MVAITVILAAVIGAFVLDLGNNMGAGQAPTASVSATADGGSVTFSHDGGDSMDASALYVVDGDGKTAASVSGESFGAGQVITSDGHSNETTSLVFDDGDSSVTLASVEVAAQT